MTGAIEELESKAMSAWVSIGFAPKDGTVVDLWCRRSWNPPQTHERRVDAYWCTTHKCWRTVGNEHYVEITFRRVTQVHGGIETIPNWYLIPTHYMIPPKGPNT